MLFLLKMMVLDHIKISFVDIKIIDMIEYDYYLKNHRFINKKGSFILF